MEFKNLMWHSIGGEHIYDTYYSIFFSGILISNMSFYCPREHSFNTYCFMFSSGIFIFNVAFC